MQRLPQVFNLGVSENSRGQSGGSGNITYGSAINLRGLGPFSTLTLIDGHRAVPQGTTGFGVDASIIPTSALDRVEVVADGASALYGSDAVAGVVNLILRRDFEGVEASIRGSSRRCIRRTSGLADRRGRLGRAAISMVAYEYSFHSNLNGLDRDFFRGDLTARGGRDFRVVQCNPGNIVVGGVSHAIPATGVTTATAAQLVPGTTNRCDNAQYPGLATRAGATLVRHHVRSGVQRSLQDVRRRILDAPGIRQPGGQPGGRAHRAQCESLFRRAARQYRDIRDGQLFVRRSTSVE